MRKVVIFDKKTHWLLGAVDIELLNTQIQEIESDGWKIISVTANTAFLGAIMSFTILIESPEVCI